MRSNRICGKLSPFKHKTLKKLDLGENELSDVSSLEISHFDTIEKILLDHNKIESKLPQVGLKHLKSIDISHNLIENVSSLERWKGAHLE